jgi:L-threonylcarbamoyladenylate synthase
MKVNKLTDANLIQVLNEAIAVLEDDGLVIYPTDTLYGIGARANSRIAIDKIHKLKGSDYSKPMSVIVPSLDWIFERIDNLSEEQKEFIIDRLPGAYTFIVKIKPEFQGGFKNILQNGKLGFRYPDNIFCQKLGQEFKKPYITTSVNLTGQEPIYSLGEFMDKFSKIEEKLWPDLFIDTGILPKKPASRIIDLSVYPFKVLR